jgi:hypothetical protein
MLIERLTFLNPKLAMELVLLMEPLGERFDFPAYWTHLVNNIHRDKIGIFISYDEDGVHGLTHAEAPCRYIPGEGTIVIACTDKAMTRSDSRDLLTLTENYLKDQGADRWCMYTERSTRAFERLYGPFRHQSRLVKEMEQTNE